MSDSNSPQGPNSILPFFKERELASRWDKSVRTLQRWRQQGSGPVYTQIGNSIFYRESDIVAFEASQRRGGRLS